MTVAAVILAATPESVLRDVEGVANARRLAGIAWAGGAVPIVVVAPDPTGAVRDALAGAPVTYAEPGPVESGPVGQICRGIDVAVATVGETQAALVWPARMGWVDAETITSLIEAHGVEPSSVLRPAFNGRPGWPVLVPLAHLPTLRTLARDLMPDDLVAEVATRAPTRIVELGDPGVTHSLDTPRDALPPFEGPAEPASGHVHEWGAQVADRSDEAPLEGPSVVRYEAPGG